MADFFKFRRELEEAKCGSKKEEKLDPVGKADADIDNDGDVDSSDEYLKNRRKAISKAMKKEDKDDPCWDGYVQVGTKMKDGKEVPNCVPVDEAMKMVKEGYYYDYPDYGPIGASEMKMTQLHFVKHAANEIIACLEAGCVMPEWYQNKVAKVEGEMEGLLSYMKGKKSKMKSRRYSSPMGGMYAEETLSEETLNENDWLDRFHFVTKKERGKTVYLQWDGSPEVGKEGERWIKNPEDANGYLDKRKAEKHAKMFGGKVQKGINESAKSGDKEAYRKFFDKALKKFGVKSPAELEGEREKEFYDYVDKNWKSDKEEKGQLDEKLNPSDDVSKWIEDFYDSDAPQFKGKSKEERREMAVAAWLDARREAGYDVPKNPNE